MVFSDPSRHLQVQSFGDLLLACKIALFAALVPLFLRLKLPRLDSLLRSRSADSAPSLTRISQIVTYTECVIRWGKPIIQPGCLTRGLTLYYFLRRAGLDVVLCFGVAKPQGNVVGHCWLALDGQPYLEKTPPSERFHEVYRFPRENHAIGLE